jgi:hypothetical protein
MIKKYRYEFSKEFMVVLDMFSKDHLDDHRKIFDAAWTSWISSESIAPMVKKEVEMMTIAGYIGDIMEKMYHHARFALRKKNAKLLRKEEKGEETRKNDFIDQKRKSKEGKEWKKSILKRIICHIETILSSIKEGGDITPTDAFTDFYNIIYRDDAIVAAAAAGREDEEKDLMNYLKRSYKNKYYIHTRLLLQEQQK